MRKIYSRFRLSSHDLEIERGRYGAKSTPPDERLCNLCNLNEVEDELHFLMICPRYAHERNNVLNDIHRSFPSVANLQLRDKFIWLMSQENKSVTLKIAYFLKRANEIRINELESRIFSSMKRERKKSKKIRNCLFLAPLTMFIKIYQLPF